jgi:hypothetical protein
MTMKAVCTLALLGVLAGAACGAEPATAPSAAALAKSIRQARVSEGFEVRLSLTVIDADGHRAAPIKLAVVGQFGADRARLVVRGISPDAVRDRFVAAERDASGRVRALQYVKPLADGVAEADPYARLFASDLAVWDMLSPWWDWPQQSAAGTGAAAGRDCTVLRSQANLPAAHVREVVSCVDAALGLALKTEVLDARRAPVRTMAVEQVLRNVSGVAFVKRMTITSADKSATEVEIYAGDENYLIAADTFAALDAHPPTGTQGNK